MTKIEGKVLEMPLRPALGEDPTERIARLEQYVDRIAMRMSGVLEECQRCAEQAAVNLARSRTVEVRIRKAQEAAR